MSIARAVRELENDSRSHKRVLGSNVGHDRRSNIPDLPIRLTTKDNFALGFSELLLDTIKVTVGNNTGE